MADSRSRVRPLGLILIAALLLLALGLADYLRDDSLIRQWLRRTAPSAPATPIERVLQRLGAPR
ncbi:MAG: hypothetical protein HY704_03725 [Gemmatimonadetes bacterium]|nr:hypothetical protein [Gemmatimonadota bacterium]